MAMDLALKAFLESGTTLRFSDDDPAANEVTKTVLPFDDGHSDGDVADPTEQFFRKAELGTLAKRESVSDANWDDPLVKTFELSPEFLERSNRRLQKMRAAVEKLFVGHPQECQQAIELARQSLIDAREEAIKIGFRAA